MESGVNRKYASAESGIWNLAFKHHRKIGNISVVFEPNSKFHSPQKHVCTRKLIIFKHAVKTAFGPTIEQFRYLLDMIYGGKNSPNGSFGPKAPVLSFLCGFMCSLCSMCV